MKIATTFTIPKEVVKALAARKGREYPKTYSGQRQLVLNDIEALVSAFLADVMVEDEKS